LRPCFFMLALVRLGDDVRMELGPRPAAKRRLNNVGERIMRVRKYSSKVLTTTAAGIIFSIVVVPTTWEKTTLGGAENPVISGQDARTGEEMTRMVIDRFNEAFNRHDADGLAALLTEDTVFEDTSPAPDGRRIEGKAAVVEFWRGWFARNADAKFEAEEVIVSRDRAVVLWVYRKLRNGQPWHLRGVDVFTVRNGKVAAKLAYVKG
jgi:ketosteroid isomerase-like protein